MFIDELIEIYTPVELEKLQQRQLEGLKGLVRKEKIQNKLVNNFVDHQKKSSPKKSTQMVKENLNKQFTS